MSLDVRFLVNRAVQLVAVHCAALGAMQTGASAASVTSSPIDVPGNYYMKNQSPDGRTQEQRGIVWLDNRRVMFQGHTLAAGGARRDAGIYVWDTERNEVSRYGGEDNFCYAERTIYLWELPTWSRSDPHTKLSQFTQRYRYGVLGKEMSGICRGDGRGHSEGCVGEVDMSCKRRTYPPGSSPLGSGSIVQVQLRNDDDAIIAKTSLQRMISDKVSAEKVLLLAREPVLLVNDHQPKGQPLPIQALEEIGSTFTAYSEYTQRYLLVGAIPKDGAPGRFTSWPAGMPQPVYSMSRQGDVEVIEIPKLNDWRGIHQAMPTQRGLVYWGVHGKNGRRVVHLHQHAS